MELNFVLRKITIHVKKQNFAAINDTVIIELAKK